MGTPQHRKIRTAFRVVWAITAKDLVEAVRSKTIAFNLVMVLVMMVIYKTAPAWETPPGLPRVYVYEAGDTSLATALEGSPRLEPRPVSTQAQMAEAVSRGDEQVLGLVVPAPADSVVASGGPLEVEGYVVYWASEAAARELATLVEGEITDRVGLAVRIHLDGNRVYPAPDATHPGGTTILVVLAMLFGMVVIGLTVAPHLMIDEQQSHTLDLLLVSPATGAHVATAKALTGLFYCLTAGAVILAFNATFINQWGVAIAATSLMSLFAVALGLLVGTMFKARQQMLIWTMPLFAVLLIPVFLTFAPDIVPEAVRAVLPLVPTSAVARAFKVAFAQTAPASAFAPQLAYVTGWAVLLLAGVAWVVRRADR
jgi:ABC-type multidrug transport system permease subunit